MAHSTFTLTGKHTSPSGTAHVGTVKVTPNSVIYDTAGAVVMAGPDVVPLDATGAWSLVLPCDSAGLNPATGIGFTVEYLFRSTSLEVVSFYATAALASTTLDAAAIVTTAIVAPPLTGGGGGGDVVIVDATTTTKGIVQLAGDLAGTAGAPTVPGLAGKADTGHTHTTAQVTGLDADLAGKSDVGHTHTEADVTGLAASLAGKSDVGHTHATSDVTGLDADLAGKANVGHTHTSADVSDFTEAAQDVVGGMVAAAGGTYDDAAGTITLPAGGGASPRGVMGFRNIPTLQVSTPGATVGLGYTRALGLLTLVPIFPDDDCTLDQLTVNIGTGMPGSSVRLGVYAADADGKPTGLPLVDATVSGTSSGNKSAAVTVPLAAGGTYFLAAVAQGVQADGAPMGVNTPAPGWFQDIGSLVAQDRSGYYIPLGCSLGGVTAALPDLTGAALTRKLVYAWAIVGRLA